MSAITKLEMMYDAATASARAAPQPSVRVIEKVVYLDKRKPAYRKPAAGTVIMTPDAVAARLCGHKRRSAIDPSWVLARIAAGKCMATGIEFDLSVIDGRANPLYPSIDRIDSSRGYAPDNVQIVVLAFNSMKSSMPMKMAEDVIIAMADGIQKRRSVA